jgi:hypothetical protein
MYDDMDTKFVLDSRGGKVKDLPGVNVQCNFVLCYALESHNTYFEVHIGLYTHARKMCHSVKPCISIDFPIVARENL